MKEEKQQRSIAELWDRFQRLANYIETEKTLQSWGTKGSDGLSHDGRNHAKDESELQSLRTELLERCKEFWAIGDKWAVLGLKAKWGLVSQSCNSSQLMEFGAASFFIAWEIEQRAIEAQKGGLA